MKKSGYRTIFHIFLIFFTSMLGTMIAAIGLFYLLVTVQTPGGSTIKSDRNHLQRISEIRLFLLMIKYRSSKPE